MPVNIDLDRVLGGVALLALHETDSLAGHAAALRERVRAARDARSLQQFMREQRNLHVLTRRRFRDDHAIRRELWHGLIKDLRVGSGRR
jgi:hypothetical protein